MFEQWCEECEEDCNNADHPVVRCLYLGDGAYVSRFKDGQVMITTGNHIEKYATNKVFLDDDAITKLTEFLSLTSS